MKIFKIKTPGYGLQRGDFAAKTVQYYLLLFANGTGILTPATFIQRIRTKGGKAPAMANASQKVNPFRYLIPLSTCSTGKNNEAGYPSA
jgi:hypothetical protein